MNRFDIIKPNRFNISTPNTANSTPQTTIPNVTLQPQTQTKPPVPTLTGPTTLSQGEITIPEKIGGFLKNTAKRAVAADIQGGIFGRPVPDTFADAYRMGNEKRSKTLKDMGDPEKSAEMAINFMPIGAVGSAGKAVGKEIAKTGAAKNTVAAVEEAVNYFKNKPPTLFDNINDTAKVVNESRAAAGKPPVPYQSLEDMGADLTKRTPANKKVNWLDVYGRSPEYVMEKIGLKSVYNNLRDSYNNYSKELPDNLDKIGDWAKKVTPEANEKIFNWLDGDKSVVLDPTEKQVATEIKTWLGQFADRLGMAKDERISDYITHIFPASSGGEIPEEIAKQIRYNIPGEVYSPYQLKREGVEGYIKDTWRALDAYAKNATRKIHMDDALAEAKTHAPGLEDSQEQYLRRYISNINLRPSELDTQIDNGLKQVFGYRFGVRPQKNILSSARRIVSRAKLGLSVNNALKNLTQGVNTFSELGTKYTLRGYKDLFTQGGKELKENGVLTNPIIEDRLHDGVRKFWEKADKVIWANFEATEKINRGAAYYGAKARALDAGKSMEEAIYEAVKTANKTQFTFGPIDTPVGLNSEIFKTLAQFQTFNIKQLEFLAEKARKGEVAALARYVASGALVYGSLGSALGMSWTDVLPGLDFTKVPPALNFLKRTYDNVTGAPDKYGNERSVDKRLSDQGEAILTNLVPGGAQIKRTFQGIEAVNQGKSTTPAGTFQYRVPQTGENYLKAGLFGKGALPESQKFYKDKKNKGDKNPTNRFNVY